MVWRRIKRVVVGCGVRRLTRVMVVYLMVYVFIVCPVFMHADLVCRWTSRTRVWSALWYIQGGGARVHYHNFSYVLVNGRWADAWHVPELEALEGKRWSAREPGAVGVREQPDSIMVGLVLPWFRLDRGPSPVRIEWSAGYEYVPSPEELRAVMQTYARDGIGDASLAAHLPQGGAYSLTFMPLGAAHDAAVLLVAIACAGRIVWRRPIARLRNLRAWRARVRHCPRCGYDRSGLLDRVCPECGWPG